MTKTLSNSVFLAVIGLIGAGLVQVYSSSYIYAIEAFGHGWFFFQKQLLFALAAMIVLIAVAHIPLKLIREWGWLLWLASFVGLLLTFVPGISFRAGGAARWLQLPFGFRLEPAEFLKVAVSLLIASALMRRQTALRSVPWWLIAIVAFVPFVALLKQPDFGSFSILVAVVLIFLFAQGLRWRYLLGSLLMAVPAFYLLVMNVPYRRARVLAFLDPWSDPDQKGFQVIQSLLAFSSGGLLGVGIGEGQGKLFFLPEAHTDFTLAVLGEEVGFIGFLIVMLIYGFLIVRGLQIVGRTRDPFFRNLALCLTVTFALNVFINVGVALGMLPTKGLTLPFLSYGGSSLVSMAILFGLLLNIDRHAQRREGGSEREWAR